MTSTDSSGSGQRSGGCRTLSGVLAFVLLAALVLTTACSTTDDPTPHPKAVTVRSEDFRSEPEKRNDDPFQGVDEVVAQGAVADLLLTQRL